MDVDVDLRIDHNNKLDTEPFPVKWEKRFIYLLQLVKTVISSLRQMGGGGGRLAGYPFFPILSNFVDYYLDSSPSASSLIALHCIAISILLLISFIISYSQALPDTSIVPTLTTSGTNISTNNNT
jgi:hypothetical protein